MGTMIPLGDASRRPLHRPVVTACIIFVNVFVFTLELSGGEPFVTQWSVIPAQIVAGHGVAYLAHIGGIVFGALTARLFENPRRLAAQGG